MINYNVKFVLNIGEYGESSIEKVFNRAKNILNWQFDENFNVKLIENNINYQMMDVSDLKRNEIEKIITSFFDVTFDNIIDVELYKFLVLKDNNELQVLANISSLIFDYASINEFCELFIDLNKIYPKYDLDLYYNDIKNYLNSSNFEKDSIYWKNHISNSGDYIKFYNLNENKYKSQIINVNKSSLTSFIKNYDCSIYEFYGSIFALYLSFIDRFNGCLFKTTVHPQKNDLNTILKIDVNKNNSFIELLNEFNSSFKNAMKDTKVDVDNYLDENVSYYSIYDFSDLNENIDIYNGEDSALTLNIYENYLELVYNTKLFSDVYIEHMVRNIEKTIDEILNYPEKAITGINLISDEEKSLLEEFCKGEYDEVDEDEVLCEVFRKHATDNPEAIAVDDGVNQVTYGELEKSSNSIAHDLKENYHITSESRVALMLKRNYHFAEIVLALNKIGASFIPIDLLYPGKRVEHMLNIADANCIISSEELKSLINFKIDVIFIEDLNYDNEVDFNITCKIEDLFSILFTSGTTGIPKGVMISNNQVVGLTFSFEKIFNFSQGDVCGCYLSFSFIASYLIYVTFYLGGCCRIFNENEQKDILSVVKTLKEKPMNNLILPPSIGIPIFENGDLKLDYLVLAGAKLNELSKKDSNTQIANFYGTTEVAFAITKIYDSKDINNDNVPIGRPVTNTWAYILDDNNRQMPVGVSGEICISSEYISPGYFNNPELTRKSFVENPYSTCKDNKIMYRTGDIGFYNFDGEIEIIGREDDQLSVRGFRIEKDEILNIIGNFEEITDVYIDVENDNLIAYYTSNDEFNIENVKDALKEELPYYMVPSLFIKLDEIPLTLNGKIDRTKLKSVVNNENIEITDDVIGSVVDAFKEVLHTDSVLMDDDFVSIGGNSLSAMKLQLLLKDKFGVTIFANEIIELSTPVNIANKIKFNLDAHSSFEVEYTFEDKCPLSESQLNVYLDETVNDMGTGYNNPFKIEFKNDYSIDKIVDGIKKLLKVYPILSARVVNDDESILFSFDAEPEINVDYNADINSFVHKFDLEKYLSRFLIMDNCLLVDFHHLIFDGSSLNIIINTLLNILDECDVDFIDNGVLREISFEKSILDTDYMDNAAKFFDLMLSDRDDAYDLLPCVNGEDNDKFEYIDVFNLDGVVLSEFLQNHSITHNQFFTSVFAYTLSRFTGSSKSLFNLVENGRGHVDLFESVGMFVRTLPLLIDCSNQSVRSFLTKSADLVNSVMNYELYPFRVLASKYDLNSNILFQYSHNIIYNALNKEQFGYAVDELDHDVNGDLLFNIFDYDENAFGIRVLYSDKYSKNLIQHFVESFKLILNDLIEVEELSEINYTTEFDLQLMNDFNGTEHQFEYKDVLDAFNVNLAKFSNNKLVSYKDNVYTYGEGAYIANEIAKKLNIDGVSKQDFVALFVPRSEWFLLATMGVLSMGGIYVPIDTNYPDERIAVMLNDTESKVVIVNDESEQRICKLILDNNLNINVLNVSDIVCKEIFSLDYLNFSDVDEDDVACVLYTSGTTGIPKGVVITRKALNNFVLWYVKETNFTSTDIYGMHCSYVFDIHTAALFAPLVSGGSLCVVPEELRLNLKALNDFYVENGCTHTYITSQVGKLFAEMGMETTIELLCFGGMKLGELNAPDSIGPFETYGPSENLAVSTSIFANNRIHHSSIGSFISNVKGYVLDEEHRRLPLGAVGELYLAGHQLSSGYLNRDEENLKSFLNNPFDDDVGYERIYGTGDMVRFLPDGTLGIVGRRDSQVKIRGNRVELSEVESAIRNIDFVEDVTVQTVDNGGSDELVAYVVPFNDCEEDFLREFVCNHVAGCKPDYMVPSYVIKLDNIPLNINGKVDKKALPEINLDNLHNEYVAPTNGVERDIVEAFEKVFNREKISIYDDFVQLGGDSLTAIRLLSNLDDYDISAGDILSLHTPYAIAKDISDLSFDLDIYSLESGCPLSEPQLNVYLDIMAHNKIDSYRIPLIMEISKEHDVNDIVDALNSLLNVHPILNMCVSDDFDVPYLIESFKPSISIESDIDDDSIVEFLTEPFDMSSTLSRFLIADNENDDNYILFAVFHHIIFDALSGTVFKRDFQSILEGKSVAFDDSFLRVSAFNTQIKDTDNYLNACDFYESMLVDSDDADILLDSIGADGPGTKEMNLNLDNDLFKSFLTEYKVSENVVFTSVFAYTLSRFVGSEKVLFNITENGRDRFNNYDSIGMYVNTLPLLVDCKNNSISKFMEHVSDLLYDVMKYNYYPFRLLANKYDLNSNILFQFLPDWVRDDEEDIVSINIEKEDILREMEDLIADFSADVIQNGNDYSLSISYSDKYSEDFVERFMESYKLILCEILKVDKLADINYINEDNVKLLDDFNRTECSLVYDDVLDAFNENLVKYPNNKLVSVNDISYSYGEGAYIADKIAKKLREFGVVAGDCVGFLTERSEYYMFAILGILSVGGVYVPLDDNHPDERIKFILKDTDTSVIIVSDGTYNRCNDLIDDDIIVLNIFDILKEDIKTLSNLPMLYSDLACILYTSGTTGVPKGVKITRKAILNYVEFYVNDSGINASDVYGLFASIGFDVAIKGIFSSIYVGASLNIIPEDIKFDMIKLNDYFDKYGITHTHITSQVAKLFVDTNRTSSLKALVTGGEKLGEVDCPKNYQLIDTYGPTEACVYVTSINQADKIDSSSVGYLLNNTKVYVLDGEKRRVPLGAVGEVYLAGNQIANGYLNRKEETQKAFIKNPFDENDDYSVLYCTGDIGRMLPDGSLSIVGRHDSQVKVRGNRVELSEVESVIRNLDIVDDLTVQVIKNNDNNELVVYIVLSEEIDSEDITDIVCSYVAEHKPDYMVPSFVIKLESIPLNINGKVDKRALPEVDFDLLHADYIAPRNEKEKKIVEAFEKVFNMENISIYDDFVRLGGDSLAAIKLLHYIDSDNITMADILSLRTPEAIAKNIWDFSFDLDIYSLEEGCPLNGAQINVLADVTIYNKTNAYHIPGFIKIPKKYTLENILDALNKLLDVHPILSMHLTKIYEVNEENDMSNLEMIRDSISIAKKFGIKDIMAIVKSYGIRNVKGLYNMLQTAMKLLKGEYPYLIKGEKPPISVHKFDKDILIDFASTSLDLYNHLSKFMIMESDDSYYLFFVIHHIIFDAASHRVFDRNFQTILDGGNVDLDDTFLKVSAFAHHIKNTEKFDEASEFFGSLLADVDEAGLLIEDKPSATGYNMSQYDLELDENALNSYLKNAEVSENILFTSVFAYTLSKLVKKDKVIFTMIENGRDRFNGDFIDMTSNVMPLLIDCKDQSINAFFENTADIVYGAMKHSYYPILLLYQKYNFEVNILFHYVPDLISHEFEDIEDFSSSEIINHIFNLFDDYLTEFFVQVQKTGDNYTLIIVNSNKYSDEMVKSFKDIYISMLSNIIYADCSSDLSSILNNDFE